MFFNLLSIKNIHPIYHLTTGLGSLLFLGLFLYQENKTKNALLDLHLYKIINFRLANIGFFLFFLVNVGSRFLRPFYFEEVRALSTQESGALMMVAPSIMLLVSAYIDKLSKFFNTKQLVITGNLLLCLSMWMFSLWDHQSDISFLIFSMIILGLAMGVYYPSTTQIGMKSIPHQSSGMGSASISISKSIGKLMGVLFFGILFQFFLNYLWEVEELETLARTHSIQYVFVLALIISLINSLLSFKIKAD